MEESNWCGKDGDIRPDILYFDVDRGHCYQLVSDADVHSWYS